MANAFETAILLCELGYSVIPSGGGDKHKAPLYPWKECQERQPEKRELENWQYKDAPQLWGIVTGSVSGIVVVDADTPEALAALQAELGIEPHILTPRGGGHWYFKHPGHQVKTTVAVIPDVDIRADGGFVNIVGSRPDGEYNIIRLPQRDNLLSWELIPRHIRQQLNGSKPAKQHRVQGESIPDTTRNATLISMAGSMRRAGLAQSTIEAALLETNKAQCQPPLDDAEVITIAKSISRYHAGGDDARWNRTDAGNAEHFTAMFGDTLRYDHQRRRWLRWHVHYWKPDIDKHVTRLALHAIRERFKHSLKLEDSEERKKEAKWAIDSEARARIEATIALSRDLKPIADSGENWDADPWLLCVKNGVIDLRTGKLRPGKSEDRITMQSPVEFNPGATTPRWLQFLDEIFNADQELIDWLQRYFGYCLTGDTREQNIGIGYGKGSNGKGRLQAVMRYILGDYAYDAPFSTFELHNRSVIPNDLAALVGRRFVTSSETNESTRLNEARIKALTGQDPVTARFLNAEFFTFMPVAKFFLAVNHRPRVSDDSYGFWRRVRLIPFTRIFRGQEDDKLLLEKLLKEASGILNWLIKGCLDWQATGLDDTPGSILVATNEYQSESDPLSEFLWDECTVNSQAQVSGKAFYKAYTDWCKDQAFKEKEILTNNAFGRKMGQKFEKGHERTGAIYRGVGLKCDGFVTDFETTLNQNELPGDNQSRVGSNTDMPSQSVTSLKNPSRVKLPLYPEKPCSQCGKDAWGLKADGKRYYCTGCEK